MAETIAMSGSLAQRAGRGGSTWARLQYVLGLRQLGWDVLFIDRIDPEMCVDAEGRPCAFDRSVNLAYFTRVMRAFDLMDSACLIYNQGEEHVGLGRRELLERASSSLILLNVMGFLDDEEILSRVGKRVFLDIDPGFGQMWRELGLADPFAGHELFVTIGLNIGRPQCDIPTCGLQWVTSPPPIVLSEWPEGDGRDGAFTSVASWRGAYGPIEFRGKKYGLRVHEFRTFASVPRLSGEGFELALDIHPDETADLERLADGGWTLVDPRAIAGDPWSYRHYVQGSKAEFGVAKHMYVETNSGWVSDRSLCYLASGKPVVTQDTGLGDHFPLGEGLITFRTLDDAVEAVKDVSGDYQRHARAARTIAEDYFDSNKVLKDLLDRLDIA